MFKKKSRVQWKWLGRTIDGQVEQVFLERITMTIKGKQITRNGSKANPAYLVLSNAGNQALKLGTELVAAQDRSARKKPTMF